MLPRGQNNTGFHKGYRCVCVCVCVKLTNYIQTLKLLHKDVLLCSLFIYSLTIYLSLYLQLDYLSRSPIQVLFLIFLFSSYLLLIFFIFLHYIQPFICKIAAQKCAPLFTLYLQYDYLSMSLYLQLDCLSMSIIHVLFLIFLFLPISHLFVFYTTYTYT